MAIGLGRRSSRQSRGPISQIKTVLAPVGGVNARDALAVMPLTDAISMVNWFPCATTVNVRNGSQNWTTGILGTVESIMPWNGTATKRLFAAANGSIYDITSQGPVGAAAVSGSSSSRWQDANFNAGGGTVLLAFNGVDAPQRYDVTTQGAIESIYNLAGGTLYTNGTYTTVTLTGGNGINAKATITVSGGVVTGVAITTPGSGYHVDDILTATAASIGGTGSGFQFYVQTVGGWSTTTISGTNTITGLALNPAKLITVTVFKQRIWCIEDGTMNVWYGGVSAYQGAFTLLPLGAIFRLGGYLMQMATWTIDNVSGINDYAAFITSEGEVAVYQGYDPSTLATWSLVGTFVIGRPVGRRCIQKYASDVLCVTVDGLVPLSQALLTDRLQPDIMLTDKIRNAMNDDVVAYGNNFGWQVIEHPIGSKLIMNVPESIGGIAHQWVMNTSVAGNKAWTQFQNWYAACWARQADNLYYGGPGYVRLADVGHSDVSSAITVDCKPAFSNFGEVTEKNFKMARPIFRVSAPISPTITLNLDFDDQQNASPLFTQGLAAPWNTSPWNTTPWGGLYPRFLLKGWIGCPGLGVWASGRLSFQTKNISVEWQSIDYMYELATSAL